jgi:Flp pilus assembly protein TadD
MLSRAVELDPTITTAHYELGMTYLALDRRDLARQHLETAVALPPNNTADLRNQAMATRLLDDW